MLGRVPVQHRAKGEDATRKNRNFNEKTSGNKKKEHFQGSGKKAAA